MPSGSTHDLRAAVAGPVKRPSTLKKQATLSSFINRRKGTEKRSWVMYIKAVAFGLPCAKETLRADGEGDAERMSRVCCVLAVCPSYVAVRVRRGPPVDLRLVRPYKSYKLIA